MKWYAGATLLLILALVFGLGALAYAMYVLLAVLIVSRFLARTWIQGLTARRDCSRTTAEIGEVMAVLVQIKNNGPLPVPWVLVEDLLPRGALLERPPRLVVKGERLKLVTLRPGASVWLRYQLTFAGRGYYQVGPLVLETGDLFGLQRRYRLVADPQFILVPPKVVPILEYDLASRRPIGEIRMVHRLFDDPSRISGIREYEPGDALNRVHWRATARTGVLQSKTFEPSSVAGATILLDFHRQAYAARHEPLGSELAVTTAASLAHAVSLTGQQVGLLTNGADAALRIPRPRFSTTFATRDAASDAGAMYESSGPSEPVWIPTRRDPRQMTDILEGLARLELSELFTLRDLIAERGSQLPRDATVIAVVGRVDEETAAALGNLRRRGYAVVAFFVEYEQNAALDAAGRLIAAGIEARHIDSEQSLAEMGSQPILW